MRLTGSLRPRRRGSVHAVVAAALSPHRRSALTIRITSRTTTRNPASDQSHIPLLDLKAKLRHHEHRGTGQLGTAARAQGYNDFQVQLGGERRSSSLAVRFEESSLGALHCVKRSPSQLCY